MKITISFENDTANMRIADWQRLSNEEAAKRLDRIGFMLKTIATQVAAGEFRDCMDLIEARYVADVAKGPASV